MDTMSKRSSRPVAIRKLRSINCHAQDFGIVRCLDGDDSSDGAAFRSTNSVTTSAARVSAMQADYGLYRHSTPRTAQDPIRLPMARITRVC